MATRTITGIVGAFAGFAFLLIAVFRTSFPRQKRWVFAYTALCFFVFGELEYFGIVHLESWH
jgi:hypothetical protein